MAKEQMPDFKNSHPPRLLDVHKLAAESGLEPPPFQAWRHSDFVVVYYADIPGCMAVDLKGDTFIQRSGKPEVTFAVIEALYGIKLKGERLFSNTVQSLSDLEFFNRGMAALAGYMSLRDSTIADETYEDIYQAAREDFLSELIKPPKKD